MSENVKVVEMVPETGKKKGFFGKVVGALVGALVVGGIGVCAYNKLKGNDEDIIEEDFEEDCDPDEETEDVTEETEE